MEHLSNWTFFLFILLVLYLFLATIWLYYASTSRMVRKGYSPEYIEFKRSELRNRMIGIGLVIPILLLISGGMVKLVFGEINIGDSMQLFMFSLFFIILVAPFPILEQSKINRKYKELAIRTKSEIIVDYNHMVLHLLFRPLWEIMVSVVYVVYLVWIIRDFHPAYFHVAIIWFLYLSARSAKNLVAPALKDVYMYVFMFLSINHLLLIFHLLREAVVFQKAQSDIMMGIGLILTATMAVKWFYYLFNLSEVYKRFSDSNS